MMQRTPEPGAFVIPVVLPIYFRLKKFTLFINHGSSPFIRCGKPVGRN
jgi:hypothetical protein